jgi:mRNA interferase MazF
VVTPSTGSVVLIPFPFSDLSHSKLRPAVVLADAGKGDWVLCQITSKPYSDPQAIELTGGSFQKGSLHLVSYARPGKLFTANQGLIVKQVGLLKDDALKQIVDAVVDLMRQGLKP